MTRKTKSGISGIAGIVSTLFFCLVLGILFQAPAAQAQGVLADKPDVQAALNRFTGGHNYASEAERTRDQALLFANNDAINKAGLNGEIPDTAYQAAQKDFANLNKRFAEQAANEAGANFTEQKPSSPDRFSPGTDSDYITEVTSKEQIPKMQQGYNDKVNDFLKQNGVTEQRRNWHNKLDTDFMANPEHITDPNEFREIAKYNNDAYKRRMAAQYEEISRAGDGRKIGPKHVNGYLEEMNDFARKKSGKIDDMLAKGPSHFSDPAKRADLFQAMAQEQKYISRMESLDDFLRAQEGLPPRNRGVTAAKLGSNRAPGNAANIRAGRAVSEASRMTAMEDLAETMGQVSKKNPAFSPNMADDIAKIVERLPADRRAGVLARIKANGSPGLVDDIVEASARAGRMPTGSSLADDIARAGTKFDDMADAVSKMDDLADAGKGRSALGKAVGALEAIGKIADTAEGAIAAAQLADLFRELNRATDPELSPEERNDLLEKIRQAANDLRDSAAVGAIMQRHPAVAAIYGAWTVGCMAGEFASPSREAGELFKGSSATGSCLDRHMSAWDRATQDIQSWWTGNPTQREAHTQALCDKFVAAVKEGRIKMKPDWKVVDACNWIRHGMPVSHMVERVSVDPGNVKQELPAQCAQAEADLAAATALAAKGAHMAAQGKLNSIDAAACPNLGPRIASAREKITGAVEALVNEAEGAVGSCDLAAMTAVGKKLASAEHPRLASLREKVSGAGTVLNDVNATVEKANTSYLAGDFESARSDMRRARASLRGLGGNPACPDIASRIERGIGKIDKVESAIGKIDEAIDSCDAGRMSGYARQLAGLQSGHPALSEKHAELTRLVPLVSKASSSFDKANAAFKAGSFGEARAHLRAAKAEVGSLNGKPSCPGLIEKIEGGFTKIEKITAVLGGADQAMERCAVSQIKMLHGKLSALSNAHIRLRQKARELDAAWSRCDAKQKDASCSAKYGLAHAKRHSDGSALSDCQCDSGYELRGGSRCVKKKTKEDRIADANANCRKKYGGGYYAGPFSSDGSYYCLPTKATANAWCRKNNAPGYYAGRIKAKGGFNCYPGKSARTAQCRRQYGAGSYAGKLQRNGRWNCYGPQPRGGGAAGAAVAGAIAGAIINEMIRQGGSRGGGRRNCHRNPRTGALHCGSN